jgi:hypothetical protein
MKRLTASEISLNARLERMSSNQEKSIKKHTAGEISRMYPLILLNQNPSRHIFWNRNIQKMQNSGSDIG